jgi:hypothetical protein
MSKDKKPKDKPLEDFFGTFHVYKFNQERDLPLLCEEFHNGNWQNYLKDLEERLNRKAMPYNVKEQIKEDIDYIKKNYISIEK